MAYLEVRGGRLELCALLEVEAEASTKVGVPPRNEMVTLSIVF